MSGTSLDGVDAALIDFSRPPGTLLDNHFLQYPEEVRTEAVALNSVSGNELDRSARLSLQLAELYARAVNGVLRNSAMDPRQIAAIGCHGQTVRHKPDLGYSIQLCSGARLAEMTGIRVVTDFRSRDIAARGQGAPLVSAFHNACFHHPRLHRVIVNIGGVANLTDLATEGPTRGFDTGPGNVLLDLWANMHLGDTLDVDGKFAASGEVDENLLSRMMSDPFFDMPPPKSTGRDRFNRDWLERVDPAGTEANDVQATLAELSARTITQGIDRHCAGASELYLCGGGVHNSDLVRRIAKCQPGRTVKSTLDLGIDPDYVEAFAFAWLARCAINGTPSNLPSVTGATGFRVLGAIYPA
jgi:anhydro-N-acetylmuramic acid kinase